MKKESIQTSMETPLKFLISNLKRKIQARKKKKKNTVKSKTQKEISSQFKTTNHNLKNRHKRKQQTFNN